MAIIGLRRHQFELRTLGRAGILLAVVAALRVYAAELLPQLRFWRLRRQQCELWGLGRAGVLLAVVAALRLYAGELLRQLRLRWWARTRASANASLTRWLRRPLHACEQRHREEHCYCGIRLHLGE